MKAARLLLIFTVWLALPWACQNNKTAQETTCQSSVEDVEVKIDTTLSVGSQFRETFNVKRLDSLSMETYGINPETASWVDLNEMRLLELSYVDFEGEDRTGVMMCHKTVAIDLIEIFQSLYKARYPIERMELIDVYDGNDEMSMEMNNTSCFNFRKKTGVNELSVHARGLAVDVNPRYNPYVKNRNGVVTVKPETSSEYSDRSAEFPHKIDREDLCYRLFREHGFQWGGTWRSVKDYQHFEKSNPGIPKFRSGDLIFQLGNQSDFSVAITSTTGNDRNLKFDHVGIISVDENGHQAVMEASPKNGVTMTPLTEFLNGTPEINGQKGIVVKRLLSDVDFPKCVANAMSHLGEEYDWSYRPDNGKLYCSELVYESYVDNNGNHIFQSKPMNFKDSKGNIPDFWVELFSSLGEEVPEGIEGTNPNDLSADPRLVEVYSYF